MLTRRLAALLCAIALTVIFTGTALADYRDDHGPELTLHRLTNRERAYRSVSPRLKHYARISRIAERHSHHMARQGRIFHSRCLRCHFGEGWRYLGENVGVGRTVRSVHRAFMDSGPHRDNVLCRCFDRAGYGVVDRRGRVWVTVIFWGGWN